MVAISLLVIAYDAITSRWFSYDVRSLFGALTGVVGDSLTKGAPLAGEVQRVAEEREKTRSTERTKAVVRGLLIAAPIFLVLLILLVSADAIFASRIRAFTRLFRFGRLPEYAMQAIVIIAVTCLASGALVHAVKSRTGRGAGDDGSSNTGEDDPSDEPVEGEVPDSTGDSAGETERSADTDGPDLEIPSSRISLGLTESVVVLFSVDALFLAFVAIQFGYFFGGNVNVIEGSLTYAEYARRGFFELVVVALISTTLLITLGTISRSGSKSGRIVFIVLRCLLVVLVIVMLVSAFRRLLLYEGAFGFTRLRTYTHIFIVWLAIFMVVVLAVQIAGKQRAIALGLVGTMIGFCASIAFINVDSLIAKKNVERTRDGHNLDANYLAGLSSDAVPELFSALDSTEGETHIKIAAALNCIHSREIVVNEKWMSANLSRARARSLFEARGPELTLQSELTVTPSVRDPASRSPRDALVRCPTRP